MVCTLYCGVKRYHGRNFLPQTRNNNKRKPLNLKMDQQIFSNLYEREKKKMKKNEKGPRNNLKTV